MFQAFLDELGKLGVAAPKLSLPKTPAVPKPGAVPAAKNPAQPKGLLSRMWEHPYAQAPKEYMGQALGQAVVGGAASQLQERMAQARERAARRRTIYLP